MVTVNVAVDVNTLEVSPQQEPSSTAMTTRLYESTSFGISAFVDIRPFVSRIVKIPDLETFPVRQKFFFLNTI